MSPTVAKTFEYSASLDRAGRIAAEGGPPVELGDEWSPEALALAGLARCTIASLAYHATREKRGLEASAKAAGRVTKRDSDGRYAFVELSCEIQADLDPAPRGDELHALLAKAERDCFISASLTAPTRYRWRVNGKDVVL